MPIPTRTTKTFAKVVVLGDSGVGKTCLLSSYVSGKFDTRYKATIGADMLMKDDVVVGESRMNLQLWDTAGQDRFQSLGTAFYRGAEVCILVFDLTSRDSFAHLDSWLQEFIIQVGEGKPIVLLGNKNDLEQRRMISQRTALAWCQKRQDATGQPVPYFEVSAKEHFNVDRAFHEAAALIAERRGLDVQDDVIPSVVPLKKARKPKRVCC